MSKRIALYAGSFDPYTNGHHAIVRKASALFDEVVVLIGVNVAKRRAFDAEAMRDAIQSAIDADGLNARAVLHAGLITEYCAENGIRWYVRGLRNSADYDYEESTAQINHLLMPGLETIYMRSDDPVISSSMIRELLAFGRDAGRFVPKSVRRVIEAK
ncbi:MAG: pantetheine-phosphate adenylyltransferase [Clostridia bacterium]|nr:pantetheine-phosphate adenylyltransferase [Clostridia bacterium]